MKDKIRILQLGHKRVPSREGGIEIVVGELSTRMARLGHEITCYNRKRKHVNGRVQNNEKMQSYQGVHLKNIPTLDFKGLAAVSSSIFGGIGAALGKYDVVHFHAEGTALLCWLPRLFGKRVIVTIHGLDWQRAKWGKFASFYIKCGERCAAKFAHEIVVLNRANQKYFYETYGRKTIYIPNGVNRPKTLSANLISEKYGLQKDDYILYLGRLVPEKGIRYLIEAYRRLDTNKRLVIAGGSSDTEEFVCQMKALAGGDKRILFTGFVRGKELGELYSNAYFYVLPSDVEGMPLSLLEAMSYGNCCLVSDIPGCAEVVENKAVLFQHGNMEDLEKKLSWLCNQESVVRKYRREAANYICYKYNWDEIVEKTIALYQK